MIFIKLRQLFFLSSFSSFFLSTRDSFFFFSSGRHQNCFELKHENAAMPENGCRHTKKNEFIGFFVRLRAQQLSNKVNEHRIIMPVVLVGRLTRKSNEMKRTFQKRIFSRHINAASVLVGLPQHETTLPTAHDAHTALG